MLSIANVATIVLILTVLVTGGAAVLLYRVVRRLRQRRGKDWRGDYDLDPVSEEWRRDIRRRR